MATELGDPLGQLGEQPQQVVHGDPFRIALADPVLPVEVAAVADARGELAHRQAECLAACGEDAPQRLAPVHVVVRVEVGRRPAEEPGELGELSIHLRGHPGGITLVYALVHRAPAVVEPPPLGQVDVQPDTEVRPTQRVGRGLGAAGQRTMRLALVTIPRS